MALKYKLTTTPRTARARSRRLRELGAADVSASTATTIEISAATTAGGGGDGHTHDNKADLDRITNDTDGYEWITRTVEVQDPETGAVDVDTLTEKVRAGYADVAHDLTEDSPAREEFLSRLHDDTAAGRLTMTKGIRAVGLSQFDRGLEVGSYEAGASGGFLGMDANGDSLAEVARLYVRVRAFFEELTVIKAGVLAGKQYITPGGGVKTVRVEETPAAWRCWFLSTQDGTAADVAIVAGDQVIAEVFNTREGTASAVSNRRYWRLATAVVQDAMTDPDGNHYGYIDLSKTDCEPGSDAPQAGDELCQLGHRTDATRQSAMVFSTVDADAPCVKLYGGINSYTLAGRAVVSFGRDAATGQIFFRLGTSTASHYLDYTQGGGLKVAGRISSLSTYDDGSGSETTLGEVLDSVGVATTTVTYSTAHTATQPADSTFTLYAVPALSPGDYLWSRTEVVYKNGRSTKTYAASRNGEDGSSYTENLLLKSDTPINNSAYNIAIYELAQKPVAGETYTATIWGQLADEKFYFAIFNSGGNLNLASLTKIADGIYSAVFNWRNTSSSGTVYPDTALYVWAVPQTATGESSINKIKLEKGTNPNPVWTPAASEMVGKDGNDGKDGKDGESVYQLDLSDEMIPMPCDAAGNVTGSYKTSQATVYRGAAAVTAGVAYSIAQATGVSATVTAAGVVTPSALIADRGSIVVQAVVAGVTLQTTLSLYKVKPGAAGADGAGYTENLLLDSAFTEGNTKWAFSANTVVDSSMKRDGRNSVKIDQSGNATNKYYGLTQYAYQNPALNLKAGTKITFSAWVYSDDLSIFDANAKLEISAMRADGTRVQAINLTITPTATNVWQLARLTTTLPANTDYIISAIFVQKNGRLWVNSPKLEYGAVAEPVWTPNAADLVGPEGAPGADAVVYQMELSPGNITRNALGQLSTSAITVQKYKTTGASMRGLTTEKAIRYMRVGVDTDYTSLTAATSTYQIPVPDDKALKAIIVELYDGPMTLDRERIPVLQDGAEITDNLVRNSETAAASTDALVGRWALSEALAEGETYTFTVWGDVAAGRTLSVRNPRVAIGNGATVATLAQIAPGIYSAVASIPTTQLLFDRRTIELYQSASGLSTSVRRIKVERGTNYAPVWTQSSHDIDYITAALKENGSIEGGLILGSLMRLGYTNAQGKYNVTAGINGIATPSDAPAVWTGGEMIDRASSTAADAARSMIRHDGSAYFASNTVRMRERMMQVGDCVQLDESGLTLITDGTTSLHIGDVAVESLLNAGNSVVSLSGKTLTTSGAMLYEGQGCTWATGGGFAAALHSVASAAGATLSFKGTLSWQIPAAVSDPSIAVAQVVLTILVDDTPIYSGNYILADDGTGYMTAAVAIGPIKLPLAGIVKLRMAFAHAPEPYLTEVPGNPYGFAQLRITSGNIIYAPGNQTTLGNNGLLAVWGQSLLRCDRELVLMQFGSYILRVSSAGIQKSTNGGSTWTNL